MSIQCPSLHTWHRDVPRSSRSPTIAGFAILIVCGLGFGTWATMAPLEGAVVASGSFVATGQNKQVQHFEGGILKDVFVKEGDIVEAGKTLVRLDDTASKAKLRRLVQREHRLVASRARLEAEINDRDILQIPPGFSGFKTDGELASILERQQIELTATRAKLSAEQEVFRKEIAGLQESMAGYQSQMTSGKERLSLFKEELKDKSTLYAQQLVKKTDVFSLQRAEAGVSGELGELTGRIADSREKVARANQQIVSLRSTALQKAIEELRTTETELDDVEEQIRAAKDVVERIDVKAPVRGAIVKMNYHTQGGVISPGGIILEMLPINEELVIEARVNPNEVIHVREGQNALVRLSSLNQRITPMVEAHVTYLSADTVTEQGQGSQQAASARKGESFIVRARLDAQDLARKVDHFQPTPGMPADLYIKTAQRTFYDYIMQPVFDSFSRAFREH